jgi:phosphoribosylaminoimidazolecarboxamide formyltransferase/IMP cyclohydrolase
VVLASGIAESSLTLQGVTLVIDSGLSRRNRFDPRTGMDALVTGPASQASAEQRRGRAGRLGPGRCIRLWSAADQQALVHSVPGGVLVQQPDRELPRGESWDCVTHRQPSADELTALRFAWRVVKHVKSNAIVYTAPNRTLGVGAGQMSRVDSARVAVEKAGRAGISLQGCVMASDAFFPFPDGIETAAAAGVTAIVQPGGSMRDDDVIAAANRLGVAMICTGRRHFRH